MQVSSRSQGSRSLGAALCAVSVLALTLFATLAPAAMAAPATASYVVVLEDDVAHPAHLAHRHEANRGAEITHIYGVAIKGYSADLTPGQLKAIRQDPNVDYVEPDGVVHPASTGLQMKRVFANQYPQLDIDEVDEPQNRIDADLAILDTGIAPHNDLNIFRRTDCVNGGVETGGGGCVDGAGTDVDGHGTHVAGVAAAIDNNFGVVGSAPGARIWSVRVLEKDDQYDSVILPSQMSDAIAGIDWVTAHSNDIEVALMSVYCFSSKYENCAAWALGDALEASVDSGVVWVTPAGNGHRPVMGPEALWPMGYWPAAVPEAITVSAITDFDGLPGGLGGIKCPEANNSKEVDDRLADYSNWGVEVDIAAPGTCILSTWKEGVYAIASGTSEASALVAGAAADIAARYNPNTRGEVEKVRAALLSAGNFNWSDQHWETVNNPVTNSWEDKLLYDVVKEPLLDISKIVAPTPIPPPSVSTNGATEVSQTVAKVNGAVNPNGAHTNYYFQYGKSAGYGASAPAPPGWGVGNGTAAVAVQIEIGGLEPLTTYHYRIVATNSAGTSYGADQTFTTLAHPAPAAVISGGQPYVYYGLANGEMKQLRFTGTSWVGSNFGTSVALTGTPSAVAMADGSRRVYYRGSDGALHEWWINGTNWSEVQWGSDGAMGSDPTAVKAPDGTRYVYFRSTDGSMRQWRIASPTDWNEATYGATGALAGTPSAVAMADGSRRVFYRGTDGALHEWWINGANWNLAQWGSASTMASNPSAVVTANGTRYVYFRSTDGSMRQWRIASPTDWKEDTYGAKVPMAGTPAAVAMADGSRRIFYRATDNALHEWWIEGSNWSNAQWGATEAMGGEPAAITGGSTGRDAYYRGKNGLIFRWGFSGSASSLESSIG